MNQKALERISLFSDIPVMAKSFLLPLYCLYLGFSPLETTGMLAVISLALLVSKMLIGNLCDKTGRKMFFCVGLLMKAISYGVIAFSQSAVSLYIAQTLNGFAISFVSVSMYTIMSDDRESNFAERQARISGFQGKGQLFGVGMSCVLFLNTDFSNGWRHLFLISAVFAAYAAILAKNRIVETKTPSVRIQQRLPKKLSMIFAVSVIYSVGTTIVSVILVLYLSAKFTVNTNYLGMVLFVPAVIITYISPALGRLVVIVKEKKAFFFGCIMSAIFLVSIVFVQSLPIFAIVWALYMIVVSMASFAFDSIISLNAEEHLRGKISGAYLASSNLGSFIGALIAGGTFQGISIEFPFLVSAIVFIGCASAMRRISRRLPHKKTGSQS